MINAELVAGPIDETRWPSLRAHTRRISTRPGLGDNLAQCTALVRALLPEPPKL